MVIVEIAGKHLRMVTDFDMSLFLIFQSLAVSGVGQEQAHFLTLPANRRVMGKNIKDDQDVYKRQGLGRTGGIAFHAPK